MTPVDAKGCITEKNPKLRNLNFFNNEKSMP